MSWALQSRIALEQGDLRRFSSLLSEQWMQDAAASEARTPSSTPPTRGMRSVALCGKLIGAGGGASLSTRGKARLRSALAPPRAEVRFPRRFQGARW